MSYGRLKMGHKLTRLSNLTVVLKKFLRYCAKCTHRLKWGAPCVECKKEPEYSHFIPEKKEK
jgi:hypothetical protein